MTNPSTLNALTNQSLAALSGIRDGLPGAVRDLWQANAGRRAGEIKPHHRRGIYQGLKQLHGRAGTTVKLLATYEREGANKARIRLFLASAPQIPPAWFNLGTIDFDYAQKISISDCPTCVGNALEALVRQKLSHNHKLAIGRKPSAHHTGSDFFELQAEAEYLRELVESLSNLTAGRRPA